MMSVAFREGVKIPPSALNDVILGAGHDVRQVLDGAGQVGDAFLVGLHGGLLVAWAAGGRYRAGAREDP